MEPRVALLGTGLLGTGMAEHFLATGTPLTVWNRTRAKAEPLATRGAVVAATPAEAVRGASRVHLVLYDDLAVDSVLDEIAHTEAVVIDHTTTAPARTLIRMSHWSQIRKGTTGHGKGMAREGTEGERTEGERTEGERGFRLLHCPVFMSPAHAREGKGMMLACGPQALFESVAADLKKMTGEVWYLGERGDLAAAYKLFGNAMLSAILGGLSDVMTMADEVGIARSDALSLFDRFQPAGAIKGRGPRMADGVSGEPSFMVETARKDLGLMLEAAGGADRVPVLAAFAHRLDALIAEGRGAEDLAAVGVEKRKG